MIIASIFYVFQGLSINNKAAKEVVVISSESAVLLVYHPYKSNIVKV
jgi:hypothetical protein